MFDLLFGWRKASKCKKLIKRVQCRLKLLKNKRGCIVKQLREDVAGLLRHGLDQAAFDRVEQLIMDENMVQVYDLLHEFFVRHLGHISSGEICLVHFTPGAGLTQCGFSELSRPAPSARDCPNDINEAVSTLIFSSARFGELPELLSIRKLFDERYGKRFATTALELLPGNLVNYQIREHLYTKEIPDDVKYRSIDEIARTCVTGPLLLEYKPEYTPELQENDVVMDFLPENQEIRKFGKPNFDQFGGKWNESSSETSTKLPEEVIYLDDIEEFVSPVIKNGSLQDQRLFMFRSFGPKKDRTRSSRRTRKRSRRKNSVSQVNSSISDMDCAVYYGETEDSETSPVIRRGSRHREERKWSCRKESMEKLRAVTMPYQRGEGGCFPEEINRSNSLQLQCGGYSSRSHIHPKLPDYDELAAKFMELKRENLLKQKLSSLED